jgi:RND superfamily putative drug exporter
MGYGGVATVAVDMLAALTVMPALLAVLGHRVNALRVRRSLRRPQPGDQRGAWYRIAGSVMRRPVGYVVVIIAGLLTLGAPFLSVNWGGTDARVLSASSQPRQVTEALNRDFPVNATSPIEAMVNAAPARWLREPGRDRAVRPDRVRRAARGGTGCHQRPAHRRPR